VAEKVSGLVRRDRRPALFPPHSTDPLGGRTIDVSAGSGVTKEPQMSWAVDFLILFGVKLPRRVFQWNEVCRVKCRRDARSIKRQSLSGETATIHGTISGFGDLAATLLQ